MTQHKEMCVSVNIRRANYCVRLNSECFYCSEEEDRKWCLRFTNTIIVCDRPPFKVHAPNCDRRVLILKGTLQRLVIVISSGFPLLICQTMAPGGVLARKNRFMYG